MRPSLLGEPRNGTLAEATYEPFRGSPSRGRARAAKGKGYRNERSGALGMTISGYLTFPSTNVAFSKAIVSLPLVRRYAVGVIFVTALL